MNKVTKNETERSLRPRQNRQLMDAARKRVAELSFTIDAAKIWNKSLDEILGAVTLLRAKRVIKKFCLNLHMENQAIR